MSKKPAPKIIALYIEYIEANHMSRVTFTDWSRNHRDGDALADYQHALQYFCIVEQILEKAHARHN